MIAKTEINFSIDFAYHCRNIDKETHEELTAKSISDGRMLGSMLNIPSLFLIKSPNK